MRRWLLLAAAPLVVTIPLAAQTFDLPALLSAGKLRAVNRQVALLSQPGRAGVHVAQNANSGVIWIDGSDVAEGTITVDVRGKDVPQQSFLGVAFHRKDDNTYEAVYLRPFNFRAAEPNRQHAIQYMVVPEFDWPVLRQRFPEEFENPVDPSISPTDWVTLRVVIKGQRVQIFVGPGAAPSLEVRKLGTLDRGQIGLWVGNNSDGDFSNLKITPN